VNLAGHDETRIIETVANVRLEDFIQFSCEPADQNDISGRQIPAHKITYTGADDLVDTPTGEDLDTLGDVAFFKGNFDTIHLAPLIDIDHQQPVARI
jgi:hypothetical protein